MVKPYRHTARQLFSRWQLAFVVAVIASVAVSAIYNPILTLQLLVGTTVAFYVVFVGLKVVAHIAAGSHEYDKLESLEQSDPMLPSYTIFVPLYREANMLPSLVRAIDQLRYPREKLQVLILLEEDDVETIDAAVTMGLPSHYEIVVVPDLGPKTKPKACNIGLGRARGEMCVIYDAEDRPEPDQLLKAVAAFRGSSPDIVCVQARLFFWNGNSNLVSRFYWAEYVIHFEWMLRGLDRLGLVPPLGGTSNHFITAKLKEVAIAEQQLYRNVEGVAGWDPFNVTEDAELAGALAMKGYNIRLFDSLTGEEAPDKLSIADKQRRRWLKGYMQTGLVYTRMPVNRIRTMGFLRWFNFNLLMLGTPLSLMLNPIFWALTIAYFVTRSQTIETLFPAPVFYLGVALMVAGNVLMFLQLLVACLHRQQYGIVKFMFLAPLWWLFTSWSAWAMCYELLRKSTRYRWHKTTHGHDLHKEEQLTKNGQITQQEPPRAAKLPA